MLNGLDFPDSQMAKYAFCLIGVHVENLVCIYVRMGVGHNFNNDLGLLLFMLQAGLSASLSEAAQIPRDIALSFGQPLQSTGNLEDELLVKKTQSGNNVFS
jgi:hypothetical protein